MASVHSIVSLLYNSQASGAVFSSSPHLPTKSRLDQYLFCFHEFTPNQCQTNLICFFVCKLQEGTEGTEE